MIAAFLVIGLSYAQKERELILNKDTGLIEVTYYHDNGAVSQTGYYTQEGKLHGDWFSFCKEGSKLISAQYDNGSKVGTWVYWMDDVVKEVEYSKNLIAKVTDNYEPSRSAIAKN